MPELQQLLLQELQNFIEAETELTRALPQMAGTAHNPRIGESFERRLEQTKHQLERLQQSV